MLGTWPDVSRGVSKNEFVVPIDLDPVPCIDKDDIPSIPIAQAPQPGNSGGIGVGVGGNPPNIGDGSGSVPTQVPPAGPIGTPQHDARTLLIIKAVAALGAVQQKDSAHGETGGYYSRNGTWYQGKSVSQTKMAFDFIPQKNSDAIMTHVLNRPNAIDLQTGFETKTWEMHPRDPIDFGNYLFREHFYV